MTLHEQSFLAGAPPAPATRFGLLRLLDLPHLAFAVLFFGMLFRTELNDPDYFWHLKAGEYVVSHMALPSGDPFSYTFQGKPWAVHEWLFEVGLYGVFALLGPTGVKVLTAFLGILSTYIVYRAANRLLGKSTMALALSICYVILQAGGFAPRPQLVSYVLFAAFVQLLVAFKYFADDRRLWLIPPLLLLWVNMHGGYVIGIVLLGLFCCCEWFMHWTGHTDAGYRRRLVKLSLIAAVGALATVLNPDNIGAWLFPFQVMNMDFANSVIAEWQSPNFHDLAAKFFLLFVFAFFLAYIYRRTKPDLTEVMLPMVFLFAGFVSTRHIPLAALILVPFVAVALRDGPAQQCYSRVVGSGRDLGNTEYVLNWIILCVVGVAFYVLNLPHQLKEQARLNETMPVKAVEFIKSRGITGRMFNEYGHGGYLIHQMYPQRQVFIDGRADVYGGEFIKEFIKIRHGSRGWDKAFDKYAIDYLITRRDAPIRDLLLARGDFKLVYEDDANSVLVRKIARFEHLAEQKAE